MASRGGRRAVYLNGEEADSKPALADAWLAGLACQSEGGAPGQRQRQPADQRQREPVSAGGGPGEEAKPDCLPRRRPRERPAPRRSPLPSRPRGRPGARSSRRPPLVMQPEAAYGAPSGWKLGRRRRPPSLAGGRAEGRVAGAARKPPSLPAAPAKRGAASVPFGVGAARGRQRLLPPSPPASSASLDGADANFLGRPSGARRPRGSRTEPPCGRALRLALASGSC
ncbi:UNVERIFIED_CONTAM: hypothetical protein K2H54_029512 [Gekko kuhli]